MDYFEAMIANLSRDDVTIICRDHGVDPEEFFEWADWPDGHPDEFIDGSELLGWLGY